MTSLTKVASVMLIALAPVINAQTPVDTVRATHNPALSESNVLMAEDLPPSPEIAYAVASKTTSNSEASRVRIATVAEGVSGSNAHVPGAVKSFFEEAPIMQKIAFCESTLRQYGANGSVLRGKVDSDDVGVMQINKRYHKKAADKLGYDLYTLEGNMKYALWLYEKEGTRPWNASRPCWGK